MPEDEKDLYTRAYSFNGEHIGAILDQNLILQKYFRRLEDSGFDLEYDPTTGLTTVSKGGRLVNIYEDVFALRKTKIGIRRIE